MNSFSLMTHLSLANKRKKNRIFIRYVQLYKLVDCKRTCDILALNEVAYLKLKNIIVRFIVDVTKF